MDKEKQKHIDNGEFVWSFKNGDYRYEKDGVYHLIRAGQEIARGDFVYSFKNGDYLYRKDGVDHLMNKEGEIIKQS